MSLSRWVAWKLVRLAARIYDSEYLERIAVLDKKGNPVIEWLVVADGYGAGVSGSTGRDHFGSYTAVWEEIDPETEDPA